MLRTLLLYLMLATILVACTTHDGPAPAAITLSVIGTNDVHGNLSRRQNRGGLTTLSGFVNALRSARKADGGAVLLIDAGDMWQGTLESNMTEGAAIVAAFNAMRYDAAAIGNHEFDFGPLGPEAIVSKPSQDPRGALKQRSSEAQFPFLAANLLNAETNERVDWPNVHAAVIVKARGVSIGIIGVITANALRATIAANVRGLKIAPLAATIEKEAGLLRAAGADLIIVTAHAGGRCSQFDDPRDLGSCNPRAEIFAVARALPTGLVDHIIAGHEHQGIAHIVNDIAITSSFANTVAFSRVDFHIDASTHHILDRKIFPPTKTSDTAEYEGIPLLPDAAVVAVAKQALAFAAEQKQRPVGVHLDTPFTLDGNPESTLGNLFTDALLESYDADIVIHNVAGGLRQNLPVGTLTFGSVYEMTPFENYAVVIELSGSQLRQVVAEQALRGRRSMGFSGMRVAVACGDGQMSVAMHMDGGASIGDADTLRILTNDYLALGGDGILTSVAPTGGFAIDSNMPLSRDLFLHWLAIQGGSLQADNFDSSADPKWQRPAQFPLVCHFEGRN